MKPEQRHSGFCFLLVVTLTQSFVLGANFGNDEVAKDKLGTFPSGIENEDTDTLDGRVVAKENIIPLNSEIDNGNTKAEDNTGKLHASRKPRAVYVIDAGLGERVSDRNAAKTTLARLLFAGLNGSGKQSGLSDEFDGIGNGLNSGIRSGQQLYSVNQQPIAENSYLGGEFLDAKSPDNRINSYRSNNDNRDSGNVRDKRPYSSREDLGYKSRIQAGQDVARDRQAFEHIFGSHGAGR